MAKTKFSVIIPLFNRELEIKRALQSCVNQSFSSFEVIVVDDASTDRSREAVLPFLADPRISLICSEANQGEWGARKLGISSASGDWIVFVDSDWELLPGSLEFIDSTVEEHGHEFERLGFGARYEDGTVCPLPHSPSPIVLDFKGYLCWFSTTLRSDAIWALKRHTFEKVLVPTGRTGHLPYWFAFAAEYRSLLMPAVVGAMYTDSPNRLTAGLNACDSRAKSRAAEDVRDCDELLEIYGREMLSISPLLHKRYSRTRVLSSIIAGNRVCAIANWIRHAVCHPSLEALMLGALVAAGPRATLLFRRRHQGRVAGRLQ